MRKILLVTEEYTEMLFLETLLKKVGFAVESMMNEVQLTEKMMSFAPDLVIATGDGKKINGGRVATKVKRKGLRAKLLLLFPRTKLANDRNMINNFNADAALPTPLQPKDVLKKICDLTGVEMDLVWGKYEKLPIAERFGTHDAPQVNVVKGEAGEEKKSSKIVKTSKPPEGERSKNYAKFLNDKTDTGQTVISRKVVEEESKRSQEFDKAHPEVQKIDEERMAFVKALFKKSS